MSLSVGVCEMTVFESVYVCEILGWSVCVSVCVEYILLVRVCVTESVWWL